MESKPLTPGGHEITILVADFLVLLNYEFCVSNWCSEVEKEIFEKYSNLLFHFASILYLGYESDSHSIIIGLQCTSEDFLPWHQGKHYHYRFI